MKKLISLVLVLVLVFALAVPSFAYPESDTEMEALNEIEYWTYWIHQDFTGYFNDANDWLSSIWQVLTNSIASNVVLIESDVDSLAQNMLTLVSRSESSLSNLLDINEYLRSVNSEISSLNDNLFGNMAFLTPFAQVLKDNSNSIKSNVSMLNNYFTSFYSVFSKLAIGGSLVGDWRDYKDSWFSFVFNDIHQLKEVLADDEDLAFKESQKDNQQYIQDTFFKPGSDLSLNVSELTDFTSQFSDFTDSFDFIEKVGTSTSPLESISEGSDFSQWFTNETGQDMDPTFGGGSGGGGETPDPDDPDPDDPDPDDPDPDDPNPPTPTIKNWLPLATSEPGGSEIYNGIGYLPGYRWSNSSQGIVANANTSISGFIPVGLFDTIYFYGFGLAQTIPAVVLFVDSEGNFLSSYNGNSLSADGNGVTSFKPSYYVGSDVSYFRFVFFTDTANSGIVTVNQYPIQTTSTFSLRAQSVSYEPEIVTSAYSNRMNEFYNLLGGDD